MLWVAARRHESASLIDDGGQDGIKSGVNWLRDRDVPPNIQVLELGLESVKDVISGCRDVLNWGGFILQLSKIIRLELFDDWGRIGGYDPKYEQ